MNQPARRTLSETLQTPSLPPEAIALIKEGSPKPRVQTPVIAPAPKAEPEKAAELALVKEHKSEEPPAPAKETEATVEGAKGGKAKLQREKESEPVAVGVVSMTFRLPADIPSGLLRASTDRKIKKLRPCTQQEIVAEALFQWLARSGYLDAGARRGS